MDVRPLPTDFDAEAPLQSDLLTLRPMTEADRTDLSKAASDPGIWAGHPASDRWKPAAFKPYFDFLLEAGGTMTARDTKGRAIGISRFYHSADAPDGIGIGFTFLVRDHWGGATNFAMKQLMVDHIFAHRPEVWFHIAPTNIRSQKATTKLGAGRIADAVLDLGTGPADWVRMVLRPDAWKAVHAARSEMKT
ncbi:GNAT family N-acetyltransferase [Gymnodinialimonas hymeniacidonis]|uniref:GNAT family N-acetyltransferase n=1 Tax=Gymnodinialimonas hymeniacidonis TaxID=3126508 RepID=UPI0034C6BBD9